MGSLVCFAALCWRPCRSSGLAPASHYPAHSAACGAVYAGCPPRGSPLDVLLRATPSTAEQTACAVTRFCCSHRGLQSAALWSTHRRRRYLPAKLPYIRLRAAGVRTATAQDVVGLAASSSPTVSICLSARQAATAVARMACTVVLVAASGWAAVPPVHRGRQRRQQQQGPLHRRRRHHRHHRRRHGRPRRRHPHPHLRRVRSVLTARDGTTVARHTRISTWMASSKTSPEAPRRQAATTQ